MPNTTSHPSKTSRKPKRRKSETEERTGLHPQWSGSLSFGLVSIPVQLYSATRNARVGLRMLAPDGSPVVRRYYCPEHEKQVDQDELTRGYEFKPGKYVEVSDEELAALEPEKSRDIDLRLFVPADSIDPVHFERMYFLTPSGDTSKAYHLLVNVMERTKRAGIATFVMHDREYLVAIFSQHGLLCAEVLRFSTELRAESELELKASKPDPKLVKQFETLLGKHAHDKFDPDSIHNQRNEAMRELAAKKARTGKDVIETSVNLADGEEAGEAETVDLMKLLKQSLR